MFKSITSFATLLALASVPLSSAAECYAVGYRNTNTAGAGPGGTTVTAGQGIKIFKDGEQIEDWKPCEFCDPVCSDQVGIGSDRLTDYFLWGASCGGLSITECHGAYGDQTHIDGEEPEEGEDFYGIGISTSSQCKVSFTC